MKSKLGCPSTLLPQREYCSIGLLPAHVCTTWRRKMIDIFPTDKHQWTDYRVLPYMLTPDDWNHHTHNKLRARSMIGMP